MKAQAPRERPRPSYKEGKLRDPCIEEMQEQAFTRDDFLRTIKKTVPAPSDPKIKSTRQDPATSA